MYSLRKLVLYSLKIIPMVISFIFFVNTILSYFNIDIPALSYIVFALLISFLYIASYAFMFCTYHRMFLHYIVLISVLNYIDYKYTIPLGIREMITIQSIIAIIFLFIILYLKQSYEKKHGKSSF